MVRHGCFIHYKISNALGDMLCPLWTVLIVFTSKSCTKFICNSKSRIKATTVDLDGVVCIAKAKAVVEPIP